MLKIFVSTDEVKEMKNQLINAKIGKGEPEQIRNISLNNALMHWTFRVYTKRRNRALFLNMGFFIILGLMVSLQAASIVVILSLMVVSGLALISLLFIPTSKLMDCFELIGAEKVKTFRSLHGETSTEYKKFKRLTEMYLMKISMIENGIIIE